MGITLRQLRAFCAVYELKNFTRAAEALNLTQSTVSKLCSELEKTIGMALFERSARGVELLEGAAELYAYAQETFGSLRAAERSLSSLAGLERGEVSVAASPIMMHTLIAPVVAQFHARHPNIVFDLHELTGDEATEHVLHGKADLGLVALESQDPRLDCRVVYRGPMYAVVPANHPLALHEEARWRELARYPHILLRGTYTVRRKMDQILRDQGLTVRSVAQTGSLTTAFAMIRGGMGITVMPGYVRHVCQEMGLKALCIADRPQALHELSVLRRADYRLSRAAAAFLAAFEAHLAEQGQPAAAGHSSLS
ncbi:MULTISPECIES: LysR family transcriptional regulator [Achromobacter]|jgi:DNA-binding transcriptional LysR family regulator|uniref:LysR family transcriptional regulator n=1 Tax=Achromobacter TaxID=222 RepID=UPI00177EE1CA|nr:MULTISPECIES: LysR family transcriptional regulator [unclassified Achromobacter]MBD9430900.1 LysR family transcriptional regulator [Achromobacter sp. ACM03]MBD9472465.1 LysR family transcriptional regulator [Achromobacter sp. ACM01]